MRVAEGSRERPDGQLAQELEQRQLATYIEGQRALLQRVAKQFSEQRTVDDLRSGIRVRQGLAGTLPVDDARRSELEVEVAAMQEQLSTLLPPAPIAEDRPEDPAEPRPRPPHQEHFEEFKARLKREAGIDLSMAQAAFLMGCHPRTLQRLLRADPNEKKRAGKNAHLAFSEMLTMPTGAVTARLSKFPRLKKTNFPQVS